jgi:hypothetical protein
MVLKYRSIKKDKINIEFPLNGGEDREIINECADGRRPPAREMSFV